MTESMQHCDIVLPAATHFECDDLYAAYGHHWLQRAEAVIPPVGESAAEHRDLPPAGGALRLRRPVLQGERSRADGRRRRCRRIRACAASRPSEIPTRKALRMASPDGAAAGAVRQRHAGDAVGQDRACLGCARGALGRSGAPAGLPAARQADFRSRSISPASDKRISSTLLGAGGGARGDAAAC